MTTGEKIDLLISYNDIPALSSEHFIILQEFSTDLDSTVRSMTASFLVEFVNETAKNTLLILAQDEDSLVRTESYDSLAVFPYDDVEKFLGNAMQKESDGLARSYAILSWADVALSLQHNSVTNIKFLLNIKTSQNSDDCLLSCSYAQYIFGDKLILGEILSYLKNANYQVRLAALSLIKDIIDKDNKKDIIHAVTLLLITEDTVAVKDRATRFLKEI